MKKIAIISAALALAACDGAPVTEQSSQATPQSSVMQQSSSVQSSVAQSSSPSSVSSVMSSSSAAASSSSAPQVATFTLQENANGFCYTDGDPIESSNDGFTGSGYVNTDNYQGAGIGWAINASSSGRYTLEVRFANGGTVARNGELNVNNGAGGMHSVTLGVTNAWTTWQTTTLEIDLVQGNNTLVLSAVGGEGLANIDYIQLSGEATSAGDCSALVSSSSSASSTSSANSSSNNGNYPVLSQSGNPAQNRFNSARTKWGADKADIILSHQYDNGGWPKNQAYDSAGNGGNDKGTFDNGATVTEMVYLAQIYKNTGNTKYRDSVRKAMQFIFNAQYPSGGWPQFYPLRGGYSDHVTFNDNAMASLLTVLHNATEQNAPFDGDIFNDSDRAKMKQAIAGGIDYILKSQWQQNGVLTVWCAQHGATDYQPKAARAYELESLSGSESVEILGFLMTQPQSPEIEAAVKAGIAWFRSPNTYLADYTYDRNIEEKIVPQAGSRMWYRFYNLYDNRGFFSDRDGGTYYDIMDISEERREGYSWGGNYGEKIISYAQRVGY